jgi:hypothetical protein
VDFSCGFSVEYVSVVDPGHAIRSAQQDWLVHPAFT